MENFFTWFENAVGELLYAIDCIKAFFDKYFTATEE